MTMADIERVSAAEVAHWYPYAVVRKFKDGLRYVHSVHETHQEASAEAKRIAGVISRDQNDCVFEVMLVDPKTD